MLHKIVVKGGCVGGWNSTVGMCDSVKEDMRSCGLSVGDAGVHNKQTESKSSSLTQVLIENGR